MKTINQLLRTSLLFALAALIGHATTSSAAPGDLDTTFGSGGIVTTAIGQVSTATGVAMQSDQKILAVGEAQLQFALAFALVRYNADGSLDTSFGNSGKVTTVFDAISGWAPNNGEASSQSVALQSDGKIVAVGRSVNATTGLQTFALARYNADGSLDTTFGSGGKVITSFGGNGDTVANDVTIQSDGKVVVVGSAGIVDNAHRSIAVARYNSDGTLDSTFGNGGKVATNFQAGSDDAASGVAVQNGGKLVVGGGTSNHFAVVRYNTDGSLDPTFGTGGKVMTNMEGVYERGVRPLVQSDGKLVLLGSTYSLAADHYTLAIARYNNDGSLDTTFGSNGKVNTSIVDNATCSALQSNGKILVGGGSSTLARYNLDGSIDTTFGSNGQVSVSNGCSSIALQSDGNVVVTGNNSVFVVARYVGDVPLPPPTVSTGAAQLIAATSAEGFAAVTPSGLNTLHWLQYGVAPANLNLETNHSDTPGGGNYTIGLNGLTPSTTYYFRAVARSSSGTVYGRTLSFTTLAAPTLTTGSASNVTSAGGSLSATVNPNGVSTRVFFAYGGDTGYNTGITDSQTISGTSPVLVSAFINGLQPNTVYHFRVFTTSASGTFYGADQTFDTLGTLTVVQKGDGAAGITSGSFSVLGNPALNGAGHIAFQAAVAGPKGSGITSANNLGIWADDSTGTRQLVVRSGSAAPGTGGALFKKFSDPVYNNNDAVAFLGTLAVSGATTTASDTGIWSNDGGTLHLVAREGAQAPGCGSGVVFKTFLQFALPDQGGVLLFAKLGGTGVVAANDVGIWAVDSAGTLQLIAREGDLHPATGKTIKVLTFLPALSGVSGQTRSFSQSTGDIAYSATFTDGTFGIFKVVFP